MNIDTLSGPSGTFATWPHVHALQRSIRQSRATWIIWNPGLDMTGLTPSQRMLHLDETRAVSVVGPPKLESETWLQYFARTPGCPYLWNRELLLNSLDELLFAPPDIRFLPYQLAVQLASKDSRVMTQIDDRPTLQRVIRGRPTGVEIGYVLDICAHSQRSCPPDVIQPAVTVVVCAYE